MEFCQLKEIGGLFDGGNLGPEEMVGTPTKPGLAGCFPVLGEELVLELSALSCFNEGEVMPVPG